MAAGAAGVGAGRIGADALIARAGSAIGPTVNGWRALNRSEPTPSPERVLAAARRAQLDPAAPPADIITVQLCDRDIDNRPLQGASRYVLRFAPSDLPRVDGFWALSVLDARGDLFTGGAGSSVSSRGANLTHGADGSVEIVVAATPPDEPTANWLAAPAGSFRIVLRAFLPRDGGVAVPAVVRRDTAA